jgi:small subunit ribosomal protein S7
MDILLFNRWGMTDVNVSDLGLRNQINLNPVMVPRSCGKFYGQAGSKGKVNVVERFINKLMVDGHRGKKHKLTSGHHVGNTEVLYGSIKDAFEIIEKRTKKNPVQVLVGAIENAALLEEVASYRMGGIIARNAVITSPQRRMDLALRHLTQGIYRTSFRNRKPLSYVIAEELIAASNNDSKSFAVMERNRIEKEAEGAR